MKRSIYGALLLLGLLILGVFTTWRMQRCNEPILRELEQAAQAADRADWAAAESAMDSAQSLWKENWDLSAALTDHGPMEQINSLFAELEIYAYDRDPVAFRAVCARLDQEVSAIGEAHGLNWWNIM